MTTEPAGTLPADIKDELWRILNALALELPEAVWRDVAQRLQQLTRAAYLAGRLASSPRPSGEGEGGRP